MSSWGMFRAPSPQMSTPVKIPLFVMASQKIHFAHLKHGVVHQNSGKPPFTRQCSGVSCKHPCLSSAFPRSNVSQLVACCFGGFAALVLVEDKWETTPVHQTTNTGHRVVVS